ncbi:unnamed protein product [Absidia cylindrospora]
MTPYTSTSSDNTNSNTPSRISISERRATYPIQERLKIHDPDTMARKLNDQEKLQKKMVLNGVNILNKTSLDSDTMMHRIKQRRETHNRVERRRRDKMNSLVNDLAHAIFLQSSNAEKHHRAKILRHAVDYIRFLQQENTALKRQLGYPIEASFYPQPTLENNHSELDPVSSDNDSPNHPKLPHTKISPSPPSFDTFCFQI